MSSITAVETPSFFGQLKTFFWCEAGQLYKVYFHILGLVCFNVHCINLHLVFIFNLVLSSFIISVECFLPSHSTSEEIPVLSPFSSFTLDRASSDNPSCGFLPFVKTFWPDV